jgi:hypothetical protein
MISAATRDADAEVIRAFVVPNAAGVEFAVASDQNDPRRSIMWGLLRGAASRPTPLALLGELTGLPDRKALGTLLYRMQRDGWVQGDVEPLTLPPAPLDTAVTQLLAELSSEGAAVLSDSLGLCFAYSGLMRADADDLAALGASLHPLARRCRTGAPPDAGAATTWGLLKPEGTIGFTLRPLHVGRHLFHLIVGGTANLRSQSFVRLVALLSRRYLGAF